MDVSRRDFVVMGLGLLLAGCTEERQVVTPRPGVVWPGQAARPYANGQSAIIAPPTTPITAAPPPSTPIAPANVGPLQAIPRAQWAAGSPVRDRVLPMDGVSRITVHHEGWKPVYFADTSTTVARLDLIRRSHMERLHAGDIGYHYVIDRAGRLWQGRDTRYQGAHVRAENEHNVGVMLLGNFDQQSPSDAQLATLRDTLVKLMRYYRVPLKRVYTHQELNPTACPGRALQPRVVTLRRSGLA